MEGSGAPTTPPNPADDPRFSGAAGELRGHVEVQGDQPFPRRWTLVLRPSTTLIGRELAVTRRIDVEDGRQDFVVSDLPLAGYDVLAEAEGMNGLAQPVLIDRRNSTPFVNLRLAPAGFVEGVVKDHEGLPAEGLTLTLLTEPDGPAVEATTDALGRYRFERVLDGPHQLVVGPVASPIVPERKELRFRAPSMILPDIELPPLATLELEILDLAHRSLPDVTIRGSGTNGGAFEGTTDAYGRYVARFLPPGRYRIRLEREGYEPRRVAIEITSAERQELMFQLLETP